MQQVLFLIHILSALALVALILLQHGKGADMGAAFGAGASGTLFGSVGSVPFLTKLTASVAAIFFASCLGLGYVISRQATQPAETAPILPATEQQVTIPVTAPQSEATSPATAVKVKKTKKTRLNHQ